MTPVCFTTPRGARIEIKIVTERASVTDRNVTVACHEMYTVINGKVTNVGYRLVDHPTHGYVMEPYVGAGLIQVPPEHVDAVRVILDGFKAEVRRRVDAALTPSTPKSAAARRNDAIDAEDARINS